MAYSNYYPSLYFDLQIAVNVNLQVKVQVKCGWNQPGQVSGEGWSQSKCQLQGHFKQLGWREGQDSDTGHSCHHDKGPHQVEGSGKDINKSQG